MTELLTLRRSTRAHDYLKSVPKPKGAVPKNSLPDWAIMNLEQKLPLVKAPDNCLTYSRGKIGKKVWMKFKDFVLDDPYCLDVSYVYDPLHDQHLRHFFANEINMKRVKELGLVNENGNAICSLKSFNEYRRYLKRVHMDLVKKERERREQLDKERRDIERAKKYAEIDAERCARREQKKSKMVGVMAKLRNEEQLKMDDIKRRMQRRLRQQYLLERRREREKEERRAKGEAFDRRIKDHIEAANKFQRRRIVASLRRWHQTDKNLKKRRAKRLRERKRIKQEKDSTKWKERMEYQKHRMKYIEELLENEAEYFAYRVNVRNEKVQKERQRMDDLLQRIKDRRGNKERYVKKRRQSRQLAKLVFNKWIKKVSSDDEKLDRKTVEKTVFKTMLAADLDKSNNDSMVEILEEVRIRLIEQVNLPVEVTDVIDKILENSIKQFLWKKVDHFINDIISMGIQANRDNNSKNIFNCFNRSISQLVPSNKRPSIDRTRRNTTDFQKFPDYKTKRDVRYSLPETKLSKFFTKKDMRLLNSPQSKSIRSASRLSMVSFGKVLNIGVTEQDITPENLKSTRERPPTPVPSLSDLAEVVFENPMVKNETEKLVVLNSPSSSINMTERKELMELLNYLDYIIRQKVNDKLEKGLKSNEERKNHSKTVTQNDIVKSIVNGIVKQGVDYSSNANELEPIFQSIAEIISRNVWKGGERRRSSLLPCKCVSYTRKISI